MDIVSSVAASRLVAQQRALDVIAGNIANANTPGYKRQIATLIEVSAEEAVSFSCNAVVVGKRVVVNAGCERLAADLRAWGYDAIPVELDEFIKSGGSAKCLTLRLDGEEAAVWD